jgi:DNA mismatch repair protein MutS
MAVSAQKMIKKGTSDSISSKGTPLMHQYNKIKSKYPDCIILFRMGDFFETFNEDANITADILGIVLTKRANGAAADVPLAGFPHHALDSYLPKIVKAGHKVAICEQVENPKFAKGIVKREVIEVVSPGTLSPETESLHTSNNFIFSIFAKKGRVGFSVLDQSTGEFYLGETDEGNLTESMHQFSPIEVLVPNDYTYSTSTWYRKQKPFISKMENWIFDFNHCYRLLTEQLKTPSLKGFGCEDYPLGISAAGGMIYHLKQNLQSPLNHISKIKPITVDSIMGLDNFTIRNLEIFHSLSTQGTHGTLIDVLDETVTNGGGRLLKKWLHNPLTNQYRLNDRLEIVDSFVQSKKMLYSLREMLDKSADIERILGKINRHKSSPRDLIGLKNTYKTINEIVHFLQKEPHDLYSTIIKWFGDTSYLLKLIQTKLSKDPRTTLKKGGVIADGYHAELDELRMIVKGGSDWITQLQTSERERTGISSLKINVNKVFGYYIEITKTHLDKVPDGYIRKQTLVNGERFIIPELKEYEEKILSGEEKIFELESRLYQELCEDILLQSSDIQKNAEAIHKLDVLTTFSVLAIQNNYVKPEISTKPIIHLINSRHPVVEKLLPTTEKFIPNDLILDTETNQIQLITGPNMAGKSTYLRQIGLCIILAQIGSFVPAENAKIGIVDRLFTRVGASDNLAGGESTFLVEMIEAANILNNATENSFILLDEVGRGTATFDGLSLAWAITEYLHNHSPVAARTLFATHYHELTELEKSLNKLSNFHVEVKEYKDKIIFLRKIISGTADKSYGIHVAQMAGLPQDVIKRATEVLLQHSSQTKETSPVDGSMNQHVQETLFELEEKTLREELDSMDVNSMTPLESMQALFDLKEKYNV